MQEVQPYSRTERKRTDAPRKQYTNLVYSGVGVPVAGCFPFLDPKRYHRSQERHTCWRIDVDPGAVEVVAQSRLEWAEMEIPFGE